MSKTCQYYFAPQSPFAYLGHNRFVEIAKRHDAQIDVRPIDLGKVFNVSGGLPIGKRSPQRQAYRLKELERWSAHLGQPMLGVWDPVGVIACVALFVGGTAVGAWGFARRDLRG